MAALGTHPPDESCLDGGCSVRVDVIRRDRVVGTVGLQSIERPYPGLPQLIARGCAEVLRSREEATLPSRGCNLLLREV